MALKGKKKARRRGSQARRRPAAPPRPSFGGPARRRWYQTTAGLVFASLLTMTVVIVAIWWIVDSRNDARRLETTQTELDEYTQQVRAVKDALDPIGSDMASVGQFKGDRLAKKAEEWQKALGDVQTTLAQAVPPPGAEAANSLLLQTVRLYAQAADQYDLTAQLDGDQRKRVDASAAGSFQAANSIFVSAIEILDAARTDAELDASGLTAPGAGPTTTTTIDTGATP